MRIVFCVFVVAMLGQSGVSLKAFGDGPQLLRVPRVQSQSPAVLDLASWSSGTTMYEGGPAGSWVAVSSPDDQANLASLLSENPAAKAKHRGGAKEVLLELTSVEQIDRLAINQLSSGGVIQAYVGDAPYPSGSPKWREVVKPTGAGEQGAVNVSFPVTSAKFVRLFMDLPEGGEVGSLFLSGDDMVNRSGSVIPAPEHWSDTSERVEHDLARTSSGGRVAYVGSGNVSETFRMVDGDPTTFYQFDDYEEEAFFIVELAEDYPVYQASIVTKHPIDSVELWSFNDHPDEIFSESSFSGDDVIPVSVSSEFLSNSMPSGRIKIPESENATSLTIPMSNRSARYLLVKVVGRESSRPMQVSLFSVIGRVPREHLPSLERRPDSVFEEQPVLEVAEAPEPLDPPRVPLASP